MRLVPILLTTLACSTSGDVRHAEALPRSELAPPSASIGLQVTALHPGAPATWTATGLNSGERVYIARASAVQAGPCLPAAGGICLDIGPAPALLGQAIADASGTATFNLTLPSGVQPGLTVTFQAVVVRGLRGIDSVKSAPVTGVVGQVCLVPEIQVGEWTATMSGAAVQTVQPMGGNRWAIGGSAFDGSRYVPTIGFVDASGSLPAWSVMDPFNTIPVQRVLPSPSGGVFAVLGNDLVGWAIQIEEISATGTPLGGIHVGDGYLVRTTDALVTHSGEVVVVGARNEGDLFSPDETAGLLIRWAPGSGTAEQRTYETTPGADARESLTHVAEDPDGGLLVVAEPGHVITRLRPDLSVDWTSHLHSQLDVVDEITATADGGLLIAARADDRPVIQKLLPGGALAWSRGVFGPTDATFEPVGLGAAPSTCASAVHTGDSCGVVGDACASAGSTCTCDQVGLWTCAAGGQQAVVSWFDMDIMAPRVTTFGPDGSMGPVRQIRSLGPRHDVTVDRDGSIHLLDAGVFVHTDSGLNAGCDVEEVTDVVSGDWVLSVTPQGYFFPNLVTWFSIHATTGSLVPAALPEVIAACDALSCP